MLREKGGDQCVDQQAGGGQQRHDGDSFMNVEIAGEKGEDQIDSQLRAKVYQHQCAQKRVGDAIGFPKGNEQHRRQTEYR